MRKCFLINDEEKEEEDIHFWYETFNLHCSYGIFKMETLNWISVAMEIDWGQKEKLASNFIHTSLKFVKTTATSAVNAEELRERERAKNKWRENAFDSV